MNTLDEVIKVFETGMLISDKPIDDAFRELNSDALHYLKEYKWNQENPDGDHQQLVKARALLQDMFSNEPLTWQELKQMVGKPVWVELLDGVGDNKNWNGWYVISQFYPVSETDEHIQFCSYHNLHRAQSNLGKTWQAYRKERE